MSTRVLRSIVGTLLRSVRRGGRSPHLTDRELARALVKADGARPAAAGDSHLAECTRCATRASALQSDLDRITTAAEAAFDDSLAPWRLVRQRRRIMHRIQRAAGGQSSARILRFPAPPAPAVAGARPSRRWLSLAAAAGLLLAVGIGQALDGRRRPPAPNPGAAASLSQPIIGPAAGPPQAVADEQFMRELEEALTSSRVTPLVALDEMTPRVRAAAIDIR
ncbi:MAG: hypothetical protein OXG04_22565 [Acidobacteria bacterium]|nr:hypothetical protein [Acidobacteriota bacterium]